MKKLKITLIVLTALAILLAACTPLPAVKVAQSSRARDPQPPILEGNMASLVDGNNTFALELYRSLRGGQGNLIFSPFSISLALAMTYAGARGETETQMADVLHFGLGQNSTHIAFNALDLGLAQHNQQAQEDRQPMQLRVANAVWAEQNFTFSQDFLDTIALNYGAGIQLADFINQYDAVRRQINAWVEDRTEDRIKDLLAEGTLDADTRMVLVNAIYFKADWLSQFTKESTFDGDFHLLDGATVQVPTMHQGMYIPYAQGAGWQAIELPYAGETASMLVIVPDQGNFESFDSAFDVSTYNSILASLAPASVELALPKFSFTRDFGLSDVLTGMGMPHAFDRELADFSGMTGERNLYISDVVHKAFVAVDEEGTEAAAATAVIMGVTSAPMFEIVLTVDRPFIFVIRDTVSGQILFLGRVLNPAP